LFAPPHIQIGVSKTGHPVRFRGQRRHCFARRRKSEEETRFSQKIGSNFQVADKSLVVEFKNPRNLLAEFNSDLTSSRARQREKSEISNWRREGDSNPR
jgi:hypothetical protein